MAEEITRIRKGNDITMKVRLFDNGEAVSWDSTSNITARLRSVGQDTFTQPLDTEVDGSDAGLLIVRWPASRQCYTGLYDLVVGMERNGSAYTTDAHAFALVATSAEAGWTAPASSDGLNVDTEYISLSLAVSSGAGTGGDFLTRTEASETYQTITDETLQTEDKTVVGAINEVLSIAKDAQPKETGKGLSTNDYTNEDKQKVGNALLKTEQTLTPEEQEQVKKNLNITEGGSGIPDAPKDGKTYGRKDGAWAEVTGGGGSSDAVLYTEQTLTDEQQEQARTNICAAKIVKIENSGSGSIVKEIRPNVYYTFGEVTDLTLTLIQGQQDVLNEYMFEFVSGSTPTVMNEISGIEWLGDKIQSNRKYQASISNGIGILIGRNIS